MKNNDSPCIKHCRLDDDKICLGCFRHIDEICQWSHATTTEREMIVQAANRRQQNHSLVSG